MAIDYVGAVVAGAAIGSAIVAGAYMVGSFTRSEKLLAYSKLEFGELILSAILVTLIISAYQSPDLQSLLTGSNPMIETIQGHTMDTIEQYMQQPLQNSVYSLVRSTFALSKYVSYYYNIQAPTPYFSPIFSDSPGSGMGPLQMQISTALDTVTLNLFLVKAVKVLYIFLEFIMSGFILPLGILLRFIPPTRKIGGILIAIALAIRFVFPAAVNWTGQLAPSMMGTYYGNAQRISFIKDPGNAPMAGAVCSEVMQTTYSTTDLLGPLLICVVLFIVSWGTIQIGTPGIYPISTGSFCWGGAGNIWGYVQYLFPVVETPSLALSNLALDPDTAQRLFETVMQKMLPVIVEINLVVLIMVVIQIGATVVLAKAFAQTLGAEGQIYGIGRLI